jgi:aspartyl-tRNA(Asn)/glutamyl-tRNA(Gln) amidotransferase subunit C
MQIDRQTVLYAAELSRLKIDDEDLDEATEAVRKMAGMIDALNDVDDDGYNSDTVITDNSSVRDDMIRTSYEKKDILANAPEHDDEYFIVPDTF